MTRTRRTMRTTKRMRVRTKRTRTATGQGQAWAVRRSDDNPAMRHSNFRQSIDYLYVLSCMCDDMKFCIHTQEAFKMFLTTPTNKSHQSGVRDSIDCPIRHGSSPSPIPKFSICDGDFEKAPRQTVRHIETITAVSLAKCSRNELDK